MPPKPIGAVARRIARQIEARLDGHGPSGDAFVVSVYGEWGVGKTYCLKGVREHFERGIATALDLLKPAAEAATALKPSFVVPVWFDPWQYEHEDHLVVPLLKTIEHKLRDLEKEVEAQQHVSLVQAQPSLLFRAAAMLGLRSFDGKREIDPHAVVEALHNAGNVIGDVAVALATGFKFKLAPLKELIGLEIDLSPKDVFDANRAAVERRKTDAAAREEAAAQRLASGKLAKWLETRESLYFGTREQLSRLTDDKDADTGNDKPMKLRFVVLVDDLDRCLPEKAIQMLESVKLFVNAPGFSFVLAVDDEVVERGIAHRYRAYRQGGAGTAPISGAEYLEKIVHLPVHLQRWTADEARDFLRGQADYGLLFGHRPERDDAGSEPDADAAMAGAGARRTGVGMAAADTSARKTSDAARSGPPSTTVHTEGDALLDLLVEAVPLVPRKLIRLAESLAFLRDHFAAEGQLRHWNALHAARLAALQQLYPPLYRHLRRQPERYWRLFLVKRDAFDDPVYHGPGGGPLVKLEQHHKQRSKAKDDAASSAMQAERASIAEMLGLLRLVHECSCLRGAPDPLRLFGDPWQPVADPRPEPSSVVGTHDSFQQFAQLYIHGLALPEPPVASPVPAGPSEAPRPQSQVTDAAGFIARLLDADPISRRAFIEREKLDGTRLPKGIFDALLAQLTLPAHESRVISLEWLRDATRVMSPEQLLRLYQDCNVVGRLLSDGSTAAKEPGS